jgi:AmiR/NasT family two-component response regulator
MDSSMMSVGDAETRGDERPEVHQAAGMVSVQLGVDIRAAFAAMQSHAASSGRSVIDVARDVVGRRLTFSQQA